MESEKDNKYLDGKIYKLICKKEKLIYIGSTTRTLNLRLSEHKQLKKSNTCVSKKIIENGDYQIILLELYPCMCKRELEKREQEWIEQFDCINLQRSYRSEEERKEYKKEYYRNNKEEISLNKKEYYEKNKEKLKNYRENNKEYYKNYREENKEKIKLQQNEKFQCECGGKYIRQHKLRHFKSIKHIDYISKNNI